MRRETLAQCCAECGQGERRLAQQHPRPGQDGREIDPCEGRPDVAMCGELAVEDRLEQWPQPEAIVGRQEVDGAADGGDP